MQQLAKHLNNVKQFRQQHNLPHDCISLNFEPHLFYVFPVQSTNL